MGDTNTSTETKKTSRKERPSQISEVLKYLQTHDYITDAIALDNFGAFRLSDIIFRLRKKGYDIETIMVDTRNRYNNHTSYARYYLIND